MATKKEEAEKLRSKARDLMIEADALDPLMTGRGINSLRRRLHFMKEAAQAADQGHWRRDHGVITSFRRTEAPVGEETTIAFAELSSEVQRKFWGYARPTNYDMGNKNSRHIVSCSPVGILRLIEDLEKVIPELKRPVP